MSHLLIIAKNELFSYYKILNRNGGDNRMDSFPKIRVVANGQLSLRRIIITEKLAKRLFLQDDEELVVRIGKRRSSFLVTIQTNNNSNAEVIFMHPATMHRMCLNSNNEYGYLSSAKEIRMGPMVGIMIEILGGPSKPYNGQTGFAKQLLKRGQEIGEICYVFSPHSIDWQNQVVIGYTYGKNGWTKRSYPFPDVVYPRERSYSYSRLMLSLRKRFDEFGVKFINPTMAGKWLTYQIISRHLRLAEHLPDTRLLTNFTVVDSMINKYQAVYLKPIIGSKGNNIIRVRRNGRKRTYEYQYQKNQKSTRGTAQNLGQLRRALHGVMGRREYLAQQPINLLAFQGHITDVRAIVQKDHTGRWDITGMGCRMGAQGSITSNISSGGRGSKISTVLERHFPDKEQRDQIEQDLSFIALESAQIIENNIGMAGEMGIDLGIDASGKTWFIEANLRPARQIFNLIDEQQMRQQSIINPLLYSRYLAGFSGKEYDK